MNSLRATPITDSFDRLEHPKAEIYPFRGDEWVPIEDARQLERDLMTLALRVQGEPSNTYGPETAEVMEKLKPHIRAIFQNIEKFL